MITILSKKHDSFWHPIFYDLDHEKSLHSFEIQSLNKQKKMTINWQIEAFLTKFAAEYGYFSTLDTVCVYDNFKKPS